MANPFRCPLTIRRFFEFEPLSNLVLKSSLQFQLNLVFIPLNIVEESERVFYYVELFLKQTINSFCLDFQNMFKHVHDKEEARTYLHA